MEDKYDVVVVSLFGRGNWLATKLADEGISTALIDLTDAKELWSPEDWEGPFGYFAPHENEASKTARVHQGATLSQCPEGFTVWHENGVLGLQGQLAPYSLEKMGISKEAIEYLKKAETLPENRLQAIRHFVASQTFEENWPAQLAHQLASSVYKESFDAIGFGDPLPLFSNLSVRRETRRGYSDALEECRRGKVRVFSGVKGLELVMEDGRTLDSIRLGGGESAIVRSRHFVWSLSSEETKWRFAMACPKLFSKVCDPDWSWSRAHFRLDKTYQTEVLPLYFAHIADKNLPWAHENFCLVSKAAKEGDLDVWFRVSAARRFDGEYLKKLTDRVTKTLSQSLPNTSVECLQMPQEYHYSYEELGPCCYPQYLKEPERRMGGKCSNVEYDGPESWKRLDWGGRFDYQQQILDRLKKKLNVDEMEGDFDDFTLHA